MEKLMVSVSPARFNATALTNTLSLFKSSAEKKTVAGTAQPTIQMTTADRLAAVADLAAKLINLKNGDVGDSSSTRLGSHASDRSRPLTEEERAVEKANWEGFYQTMDDDERTNFPERVKQALLQNDLYKNDPTFQAALKNGTLSIREGGVEFGQNIAPRELVFNDSGHYEGVRYSGYTVSERIWDKIENVDGRLVSKADGKNVAIGATGMMSFFVTWPSS
jgi:hypothetical protein